MTGQGGVFTLSLDTELAWGLFDTDGVERYYEAYEETPRVVRALVDLFDRHGISATWALVAHLLEDCRGPAGHRVPTPPPDWLDRARSLPCRTGVEDRYWHAPELLSAIRSAAVDQEVALHGYSHLRLDEEACSRAAARVEVAAAVEAARAAGVEPSSFVFPRNDVGHLEVLAENGIEAFRGVDARWFERRPLPQTVRRGARFADEFVERTPSPVTPRERSGLVEVPGSQVFRPFHDGWQFTPGRSQRRRATAGLDRAAETGGVFHLWFHPFNLALEPDALLAELEAVLEHAAMLRDRADLQVWPIREVARAFRRGRWQPRTAAR